MIRYMDELKQSNSLFELNHHKLDGIELEATILK